MFLRAASFEKFSSSQVCEMASEKDEGMDCTTRGVHVRKLKYTLQLPHTRAHTHANPYNHTHTHTCKPIQTHTRTHTQLHKHGECFTLVQNLILCLQVR